MDDDALLIEACGPDMDRADAELAAGEHGTPLDEVMRSLDADEA